MSINVLPFLPLPSYFPPKGYRLKMRAVYAHFPINLVLSEEGTVVEVRNFLGEKYTRTVRLRNGVKASTTKVKDEVVVEGGTPSIRLLLGDAERRRLDDGARVRCEFAGHEPDQRGLAGAIRSHEAVVGAGPELPVDALVEELSAEAHRDVVDRDHAWCKVFRGGGCTRWSLHLRGWERLARALAAITS